MTPVSLGFVETPHHVIRNMVQTLFRGLPKNGVEILEPGCGPKGFIEELLKYSNRNNRTTIITGIELDQERAEAAKSRFQGVEQIKINQSDFLLSQICSSYHGIIMNPPYVPISSISADMREKYRSVFETAEKRFDLYFLFIERALELLKPGGRLVVICPRKFIYTASGKALRTLLLTNQVHSVDVLPENTFDNLITYPSIIVVDKKPPSKSTIFKLNGKEVRSKLLKVEADFQRMVNGEFQLEGVSLNSLSKRISAGVATGNDTVLIRQRGKFPKQLKPFIHTCIRGRMIRDFPNGDLSEIIIPYDDEGLLSVNEIAPFIEWLEKNEHREQFESRSYVPAKPWYAFKDSVSMSDLTKPKVIWQDISKNPRFIVDSTGEMIPAHSTYYLIPKDDICLNKLCDELNSESVGQWLKANCQPGHGGSIRVQSEVIKNLPINKSRVVKS